MNIERSCFTLYCSSLGGSQWSTAWWASSRIGHDRIWNKLTWRDKWLEPNLSFYIRLNISLDIFSIYKFIFLSYGNEILVMFKIWIFWYAMEVESGDARFRLCIFYLKFLLCINHIIVLLCWVPRAGGLYLLIDFFFIESWRPSGFQHMTPCFYLMFHIYITCYTNEKQISVLFMDNKILNLELLYSVSKNGSWGNWSLLSYSLAQK